MMFNVYLQMPAAMRSWMISHTEATLDAAKKKVANHVRGSGNLDDLQRDEVNARYMLALVKWNEEQPRPKVYF
jgi:hypothetical protein